MPRVLSFTVPYFGTLSWELRVCSILRSRHIFYNAFFFLPISLNFVLPQSLISLILLPTLNVMLTLCFHATQNCCLKIWASVFNFILLCPIASCNSLVFSPEVLFPVSLLPPSLVLMDAAHLLQGNFLCKSSVRGVGHLCSAWMCEVGHGG